MGFFSNKWGVVFAVYLISLSFTSRSIFNKFVSSNLNLSTREIHKNEKCPISRANIVYFKTFTLYQNVSYKMAINTNCDALATPYRELRPPYLFLQPFIKVSY